MNESVPERETLFKGSPSDIPEPADFEKAITEAKWGKFHLMVYILSMTSGWSSMFETTTMSYVFPAAECDLSLKLEHKGLLNAITYTGMITSGFFWGYLCDTLGRKKLLVAGYFLDGVFVLLAAASQNFPMLMVAKFFGGFIINGPFSAHTAYLSELHCSAHRSKAQLFLGFVYSTGTLVLPLLAIFVLPLKFQLHLGSNFVLHSWNLYLFICAFIPLTSALAFSVLPESPKFLMTIGRNEEALKVFKTIYRMNTGKPEDTYPVKMLINEIELSSGMVKEHRTKVEAFLGGWKQMRPLFRSPYLVKILLVCLIQSFTMNSLNTLRLWLPQLFQAMNDYELSRNSSGTLCDALAVFQPNKTVTNQACKVNTDNLSVYTNSMVVCAATVLAYILASGVINKIGKKMLYVILSVMSAISVASLIFSQSTLMTLVSSSLFVATGSVMINVLLAIIVEMFPTSLRTMTVALAMVAGRCGAVIGNNLYPLLLKSGCAPPFVYNGLLSLSCGLLGLLIPISERTALR